MANKLLLKRSNVSGNAPTTAQLDVGEVAINHADELLYVHGIGGTIQEITKFRNESAGAGASTARKLRLGENSAPVAEVDVKGTYVQDAVVATAGAVNCALSNYFTLTIAAATTITFTNVPTGRAYSCTIEVNHTAGSLAWPGSVKWPNAGTAPSLSAARASFFALATSDGGATWYATYNTDY